MSTTNGEPQRPPSQEDHVVDAALCGSGSANASTTAVPLRSQKRSSKVGIVLTDTPGKDSSAGREAAPTPSEGSPPVPASLKAEASPPPSAAAAPVTTGPTASAAIRRSIDAAPPGSARSGAALGGAGGLSSGHFGVPQNERYAESPDSRPTTAGLESEAPGVDVTMSGGLFRPVSTSSATFVSPMLSGAAVVTAEGAASGDAPQQLAQRLRFGVTSVQGQRRTMEDQHAALMGSAAVAPAARRNSGSATEPRDGRTTPSPGQPSPAEAPVAEAPAPPRPDTAMSTTAVSGGERPSSTTAAARPATGDTTELQDSVLNSARLASRPPTGATDILLHGTGTLGLGSAVGRPASRLGSAAGRGVQCRETPFFAVFDGHGGTDCAEFLRDTLGEAVLAHPELRSAPTKALAEAIGAAEVKFLDRCRTEKIESGSTAAVALVVDGRLATANVGDSEIVLCRDGRPMVLSTKHHSAANPDEAARVVASGGRVFHGRVGHPRFNPAIVSLAVTRAIGDAGFKLEEYTGGKNSGVIADPDTNMFKLTPQDEFLVIGCDGLWDVMTYEACVAMTRRLLAGGAECREVSDALVAEALQRGSTDNVTVLVVSIYGSPASAAAPRTEPQSPGNRPAPGESSDLPVGSEIDA